MPIGRPEEDCRDRPRVRSTSSGKVTEDVMFWFWSRDKLRGICASSDPTASCGTENSN